LQNVEGFPAGNYFPMDKSVDRPGVLGLPWTDAGADRWHGGALTGAGPPIADGGAKERGERGEPGECLTEARAALWRPGDGEELAAGRKVGDRGA
jgi:hypothetical protein